MKKCIIYSITIYLIFAMIIMIKKPKILCDDDGNFKSLSRVKNGLTNFDNLMSLPTVMILFAFLSFYIAKYIINMDTTIKPS